MKPIKPKAPRIRRAAPGALSMSGLVGYTSALTADDLHTIFGIAPEEFEGDKVTTEWLLDIDGVTCAIYDYKTPAGAGDYEWHIGAHDPIAAVKAVDRAIRWGRHEYGIEGHAFLARG